MLPFSPTTTFVHIYSPSFHLIFLYFFVMRHIDTMEVVRIFYYLIVTKTNSYTHFNLIYDNQGTLSERQLQ